MKDDLPTQHALIENSAANGGATRKMVRERAVELAVSAGRGAQDASKSDWDQAKRDLKIEPRDTPNQIICEPLPKSDEAHEEPSATSQSLYSLVAEQPFLKGLSPHYLQLLADSAMEKQFEPGQSIFEEESPANRFYLILEGAVMLELELEQGGKVPIQQLGPGDDLGWSWLFPPYSLHLCARALVSTKTLFFYGTRLREQCEQDHDLGYQLMKRIAEVLIQRLDATQRRLKERTDKTNLFDK